MKAYGGVDVYIHIFLTSALVGGEWSASRPCRFTPGKENFIGGWVDPRTGLDDMEKWKFFTIPGLELSLPLVVQSVASRYTDWAIPAPKEGLLICENKALKKNLCSAPRDGQRRTQRTKYNTRARASEGPAHENHSNNKEQLPH
jgi:hypothetical protein